MDMRDKVILYKVNETYLRVGCEPSVAQEISDFLSFTAPGAKFMPAVRNKFWDGKIRLLNMMTRQAYCGLAGEISNFCKARDYDVELAPELNTQCQVDDDHISGFLTFCRLKLQPRDYQLAAFKNAIEHGRGVFLSPTASGKSLIIYLLSQYYFSVHKQKILIVVPTVSLVHQMAKDFQSYTEWDLDIHRITAGVDKQTDSPFVISTWQSIMKMPKQWFSQFGAVIGDEAHLFKAKSLINIMEKLDQCQYRFGFTGTLDGAEVNRITLVGLFGDVFTVTTTVELMQQKQVANLKIRAIILGYPTDIRKQSNKLSYHDEVAFLVQYKPRNDYITNLALQLTGNTLVLYQFVERHGRVLYDLIKARNPERPVYFIHGGVDADDREAVRHIVETQTDAIIVASYGTFSTGINIRNLHNVVFSSPTKSRVRTLQSIGRGLRTSDQKDKMNLYDISDDLTWKKSTNFTLNHFRERLEIYTSEGFDFRIFPVELQ